MPRPQMLPIPNAISDRLWVRQIQNLRSASLRKSWVIIARSGEIVKRSLDFSIALLLLIALSPLFVITTMLLKFQGCALVRVGRLGRHGRPFHELNFAMETHRFGGAARRWGLHRLPILWNILCGDMSFIGPRACAIEESNLRERTVRRRYMVRPGLFCLWWIRQRANIAFGREEDSDAEYVEMQSVKGDMGIALRMLPAMVYGQATSETLEHVTIQDIPIHNVTMEEAVGEILKYLGEDTFCQVCFVNAHCANVAFKDGHYRQVLQSSACNLADGIGVKLAGKILGREIRQNVNGTDLFPTLLSTLAETGQGIYLLGGRPGVAADVQDWIHKNYPGVVICGVQDGYYAAEDEGEVIARIRDSGAALLFTALGVPRQDVWIHTHQEALGVKVAIGVGGLFDFYSGRVSRAPQWVREMGMEWFYRFLQEPGRMWQRYFVGNGVFLLHVFQERLFSRRGKKQAGKVTEVSGCEL